MRPEALVFLETGHRLAVRALCEGGDRQSLVRYTWDVSGGCLAPVYRELHVRPSPPHRRRTTEREAVLHPDVLAVLRAFPGATIERVDVAAFKPTRFIVVRRGETAIPVTIEMQVRCRRCEDCLRRRAAKWWFAAKAETASSARTWFGTLTLSPEWHMRSKLLACERLKVRAGIDFEALAPEDQFKERHAEIGKLITLWLKRVRKQSEAALRYLLVAEAHKSGLPHYHCLVHETFRDRPVRKSTLERQWSYGYTAWRLVDPAAAGYVTKYLSKSALARVRASKGYGTASPDPAARVLPPPEAAGAAGAAMTLPAALAALDESERLFGPCERSAGLDCALASDDEEED